MSALHPFLYYQRPRCEGRKVRVAYHVDVAALLNLAGALQRDGYLIGELLFNYPALAGDADEALGFEKADFDADGLVATATRFERARQYKKFVQRGDTPLERAVERAWRPFILDSARLQMVLQPRAARHLKQGFESRANVTFYQGEGARYKELLTAQGFRKQKDRATAAYVLRVKRLWDGGPGYIGAFGMDSTTSLIWSYLLRHRHPELLREDGFAMAELSGPIPGRVPDLRFSQEWRSEIILRAPA
ncbi:MAG: hypothetical protein FJ091_14220 [Deltaproteobacteria bacterium]|nr:hypothetical protein [Deltaproteobacteria bacterium]